MPPRPSFRTRGSGPVAKYTMANPHPDPDPEPPAAPPIIILAQSGKAFNAPHFQEPDPENVGQPHSSTSSVPKDNSQSTSSSRYNLRKRSETHTQAPKDPTPDPFPCAPPVIILSTKRPASASPPRSPPSIQTTTSIPASASSNPNSASSTSPTAAIHTAKTSVVPTPAIDNPLADPSTASYFTSQPLPSDDKATYLKHKMGSKASKITPTHGKLQRSQEHQDKAEMKEPSNYYTHRSKSMRRKAGQTGAATGTGGGAGSGGGIGGV